MKKIMPRSLTVKSGFSFLLLAVLLFALSLIERSQARTQTAQPKIVIAGWTLTAEDCRMPDGLVDPAETVSLSIALQNTGTANTSQQVLVTLQASGGITSPSGQQDYGRLSAGGPSTSRSFTFTAANQQLGTPITLTLQISDNGVNRGTVSTNISLGLLVSDADPGLCQTGFNPPRSPSPCILTHCVSSRRPPFPVGNYTVICDTDAPSRFTMLLTVRDTQSPTIACSPDVAVVATNGTSAVVNYPAPTVTDNCQATATCTPPSGATFQIGTTTVSCTAADNADNTAMCVFRVAVVAGYEADVSPRPTGDNNGSVTITDWVQVGRFVAGLDDAALGSEFQRADCAPKNTLGDGRITVSDWVQAGRYAASVDAVVTAGGPSAPSIGLRFPSSIEAIRERQTATRAVRAFSPYIGNGQNRTFVFEFDAQGNENALGFSLGFNPAQLRFISAVVGGGANGASLNLNTDQATKGRLGVALALPTRQVFAAGTKQLLLVTFAAAATGNDSTIAITIGDHPVWREVVDVSANVLSANWITATVPILHSVSSISAASPRDFSSMLYAEVQPGFVWPGYDQRSFAILAGSQPFGHNSSR